MKFIGALIVVSLLLVTSPTSQACFSSLISSLSSTVSSASSSMSNSLFTSSGTSSSSVSTTCSQPKSAVARFTGSISGYVTFTEGSASTTISGRLSGLTAGSHGFHVHKLGDLTNGCTSASTHYDPNNKSHGGPASSTRHVGDLGNILASSAGLATISITDKLVRLTGDKSVIGRMLAVSMSADDLSSSSSSGNSGSIVACAIIGVKNSLS